MIILPNSIERIKCKTFLKIPIMIYITGEPKMELDYTYFEADEGGYVGYFTDFPQHVTEGETIEELEEMLLDMFECLNLAKYHKRKLSIA